MNSQSQRRGALAAALVLAGLCSPAMSASNIYDVDVNPNNGFGGAIPGWTNGAANTVFAAWNVFDGYPLDITPDAGTFGPAPQSVRETTGGAFLTGGNIYSFAVPTDFVVTLTGYGAGPGTRTVALRAETLGTEMDYGSVRLNGQAGTRVETFRTVFGGGGEEVESFWFWQNVANAASYVFDFNASGSSMSLSLVSAYVSPTVSAVPEPGTLALMAAGLALVGGLRARKVLG
jgi:hypothetical protein